MHLPHLSSFEKTPLLFLTVCSSRREEVLANPVAHEILRNIWLRSAEKEGWFVGQYVVMPDHVHLMASPARDACPLPKWMRLWKRASSRMLNQAIGRQKSLWQADYFDRYLRSREDYEHKWAYVELNPVRRGLSASPAQWRYRGILYELRSRNARD